MKLKSYRKITRAPKATFWVSIKNYKWAIKRWHNHDVRVDTHLSDYTLYITKPGYLYNPKRQKRIRILPKLLSI